MTIDGIKGKLAFICNNCDEGLETEQSDFAAARQAMQDEGWITRKRGDEWEHFCSAACAEAGR